MFSGDRTSSGLWCAEPPSGFLLFFNLLNNSSWCACLFVFHPSPALPFHVVRMTPWSDSGRHHVLFVQQRCPRQRARRQAAERGIEGRAPLLQPTRLPTPLLGQSLTAGLSTKQLPSCRDHPTLRFSLI